MSCNCQIGPAGATVKRTVTHRCQLTQISNKTNTQTSKWLVRASRSDLTEPLMHGTKQSLANHADLVNQQKLAILEISLELQ